MIGKIQIYCNFFVCILFLTSFSVSSLNINNINISKKVDSNFYFIHVTDTHLMNDHLEYL